MRVRYEEMFPSEIAQAMARAPIGYLPLGTLEWHGEHNAVGLDALKAHTIRLLLVIDYEMPGDLLYPHEHAAGGESSLLMAIWPDLVDLDKALEAGRSLAACYAGEPAHLRRRQETPNKYIGVLRGVPDESNDPELTASAERGRALLEEIAGRIAAQAVTLLH